MLDRIVLVRRQSPDWTALAVDYRAGRVIDPRRFVPDHIIPGFPKDIERIVKAWNKKFKIDFFTCRAIIGGLSERGISAVKGASRFEFDNISGILDLAASSSFILFFHDDDDFFAENILDRLRENDLWQADTCVFPLFRVENNLSTFVRTGHDAEFIWGRRQPFDFRFQSNNYGINGRICSGDVLRAMKDHVFASEYARHADLSETVFPFAVSATVKTPCSASMIGGLLVDHVKFENGMREFVARFEAPDLPDVYAWLRTPLSRIAALFGAVLDGAGYAEFSSI